MLRSTRKIFWISASIVFAGLFFLAIELPLQSNVYEFTVFKTNAIALNRQLVRDSLWKNWWPGKVETSKNGLTLHQGDFTFRVKKMYLNKIDFEVICNSFTTEAALTFLAKGNDEVALSLRSLIELEHNPFGRIRAIWLSTKLKEAFREILENESRYFSTVKNLYDFDIQETTVQFEFYATYTKILADYPSVQELYSMIDEVINYIEKNKASIKGSPMLNVTKMGAKQFFVQVALPTDHKLPEMGGLKSKWMLKGGHILKAEVRGGKVPIERAKQQILNYMLDNHKTQVAIPFESLITNRLEQPDSSQWKTEIYFPIIF